MMVLESESVQGGEGCFAMIYVLSTDGTFL